MIYHEAVRLINSLGRVYEGSEIACESSEIAWEGLAEADLVREGLERQQQPRQSLLRLELAREG